MADDIVHQVMIDLGTQMAKKAQEPVIMFKWGSKQKPFRCQLCDMSFDDGKKLREHMSKHSEVEPKKPFPCKICPKSFQTGKSLERHALIHYGQALKRCRFCYKVFANKENLDKHVEIHGGKKPFKCPQCGEEFVFKQGLETHMVIHTGVRPYVCQLCDKGFNRKDILERHMLVHSGNKKYKCVECGKGFAHSFVLKRHARAVHSQEFDGKECELCGKFIKSKENIRRHMKLHTGERPFKCEECGKAFSQKQHVIDHMVIHTGAYPHKCSHCGKEFKYKRSLNRHLHWHKGGTWQCEYPQCTQKYMSKSALNKHMNVHMEKKFQCAICQTLFKQNAALKRHYERFHSGETIYREIGVGTEDFEELKSELRGVDGEENAEAKELIQKLFERENNKIPGTLQEVKGDNEEVIFIVLENDSQRQIVLDQSGVPEDTNNEITAAGDNRAEFTATKMTISHSGSNKVEDDVTLDERSQLIQTLIDYAEQQRRGEQIVQSEQTPVETLIRASSHIVNLSTNDVHGKESDAHASQGSEESHIDGTQTENAKDPVEQDDPSTSTRPLSVRDNKGTVSSAQ